MPGWNAFLLIESLFSTNSASGKSHWDVWILFTGFFDTTDSSDSPYPRIPAVWLIAFGGTLQSVIIAWRGHGVSQLLRWKLQCVLRNCDRAGLPVNLPWRSPSCCLPLRITASATRMLGFRGSIPRPHLPLSTLRGGPCGLPRMTWGQDDWLHLSCMIFSFHCSLPVIWRFYASELPRLVFSVRSVCACARFK